MSLAELKSKIITDAEAEAKQIKDDAAAQVKETVQKAEDELAKLKKQVERDAERLGDEKYQNIVTLARVEGRNKVLAVKQKMIDEVFEETHRRLTLLSKEKFQEFALQILVHTAPDEPAEVLVGTENEKFVDEKFIETVNRQLKPPAKLTQAENRRGFKYGFYLVTDRMEIDLTFSGILRTVREELEMKIIKVLFGKE